MNTDFNTITGLAYSENETQHQLESGISELFNGILDSLNSQSNPVTVNDFGALHRNGQKSNPGANGILRAPTITAKFI